MSINSASMQIAGGLASVVAGLIVGQTAQGNIVNYDLLGYVVCGLMAIMIFMMYFINRDVTAQHAPAPPEPTFEAAEEILVTSETVS